MLVFWGQQPWLIFVPEDPKATFPSQIGGTPRLTNGDDPNYQSWDDPPTALLRSYEKHHDPSIIPTDTVDGSEIPFRTTGWMVLKPW